jgi:hypothetical protein
MARRNASPPVRYVHAMPSWSCGTCPVWQESGRDDVSAPATSRGATHPIVQPP